MKNKTDTEVRPDIEEEARRDVAVHLLAAIVVLVILTSLLLSCLLARHRIKQVRLAYYFSEEIVNSSAIVSAK